MLGIFNIFKRRNNIEKLAEYVGYSAFVNKNDVYGIFDGDVCFCVSDYRNIAEDIFDTLVSERLIEIRLSQIVENKPVLRYFDNNALNVELRKMVRV